MNNDKNIFFDIQFGEALAKRIVFYLYDDTHPITCKNFRELAKGTFGFGYKGCIFHCAIVGFMAQGGDFVNSDGTGGIQIYGEMFKDEGFQFEHDRRGILSMANTGPNTNTAQFFITFSPCSQLDKQHVVFGELAQETSDAVDWLEECSFSFSNQDSSKKIRRNSIAQITNYKMWNIEIIKERKNVLIINKLIILLNYFDYQYQNACH